MLRTCAPRPRLRNILSATAPGRGGRRRRGAKRRRILWPRARRRRDSPVEGTSRRLERCDRRRVMTGRRIPQPGAKRARAAVRGNVHADLCRPSASVAAAASTSRSCSATYSCRDRGTYWLRERPTRKTTATERVTDTVPFALRRRRCRRPARQRRRQTPMHRRVFSCDRGTRSGGRRHVKTASLEARRSTVSSGVLS